MYCRIMSFIETVKRRGMNIYQSIMALMSGRPIIQNGKFVGAVTHVLAQDSTKGYGIFIENMLEHYGGIDKRKERGVLEF